MDISVLVSEKIPELVPLVGELLKTTEGKSITLEDKAFDEEEFWKLAELVVFLRIARFRAKSSSMDASIKAEWSDDTAKVLNSKLDALIDLESICTKGFETRILATPTESVKMLQIKDMYSLNEAEWMLIVAAVIDTLPQCDGTRVLPSKGSPSNVTTPVHLTAPSGCSSLDLERFVDDKRQHVKDGLIRTSNTYHGIKSVAIEASGVRVLRNLPLSAEDKLRYGETKLAKLLPESEDKADAGGDPGSLPSGAPDGSARRMLPIPGADSIRHILDGDGEGGLPQLLRSLSASSLADGSREAEPPVPPSELEVKEGEDAGAPPKTSGGHGEKKSGDGDRDDDDEIKPYTTSLEYLDERFQELCSALRIARLRRRDEMKDAGENNGYHPPFQQHKGQTLGELNAKHKLIQAKLAERLSLTETKGLPLPRAEVLARQLRLDDFELKVIIFLVGNTLSPVVQTISLNSARQSGSYADPSSIKVKDILHTYCTTFNEQVAFRKYFYKTGNLASKGLIKLTQAGYGVPSGSDLGGMCVTLDRRTLDWVAGLDSEIAEVVEGSNLYTPAVDLAKVVLPVGMKSEIMKTVTNFEHFRRYRKKAGLEDVIAYGAGLVILFYGPSGTGKTLMVNAIGAELGKRILLVNFPMLAGSAKSGGSTDASDNIRGLFREAALSDCIMFFDECESIFAARSSGGSAEMTALLTELERHEGIVFLATNRAYDLDEAMHRRITGTFEFKNPDHTQRREIWRIHMDHPALKCEEDIDWDKIAMKSEIPGGFIKNAVMSSLLSAIARDRENPVINSTDISRSCALQIRGSLHMRQFDKRVIPSFGMESIIVSDEVKERMLAVISYEKARAMLVGQWGFTGRLQRAQGATVLMWGPPGTGKSISAEAIGFEMGKPLKVVNFAHLAASLSAPGVGSKSEGSDSGVRSVFHDARLCDAVLVLDAFNINAFMSSPHGGGSGGGGSGGSGLADVIALDTLLYEMERFPGTVIVIVTETHSLDLCKHRIHPEFFRRIKFIIEFGEPNLRDRKRLWEMAIPDECPLADDVDFGKLAKYKFSGGIIVSAVFRAAARACLRVEKDRRVTMDDLMEGVKAESSKYKSEISDIIARSYV